MLTNPARDCLPLVGSLACERPPDVRIPGFRPTSLREV